MNRKMKNQAGFTLVELMITIAVAIILLGVGIPLFDTMLANNRAVTQSNMFVTALNLARSEAISKNITTTICSDADGNPATFGCGDHEDWTNGWFVFNDLDQDGARDNDEPVIKVWEAMERDTDILYTASDASTDGFIRFNSLGEKVGTAVLSFRMTQVDGSANITTSSRPRCIYLNAIGQVRTAQIPNNPSDTVGDKGSAASAAICP